MAARRRRRRLPNPFLWLWLVAKGDRRSRLRQFVQFRAHFHTVMFLVAIAFWAHLGLIGLLFYRQHLTLQEAAFEGALISAVVILAALYWLCFPQIQLYRDRRIWPSVAVTASVSLMGWALARSFFGLQGTFVAPLKISPVLLLLNGRYVVCALVLSALITGVLKHRQLK